MAAAGAGSGGMGIKLSIACSSSPSTKSRRTFRELKIISAHPTWPGRRSSAIARHKANYYIDLSGWVLKYFPVQIAHQHAAPGQSDVSASDWPAIGVERWLEEFQQVNMKPEVRKKIMLDNAKKFFGLEF